MPIVAKFFPLEDFVSARLSGGRAMRVRQRDVMHRQIYWLGEYEPQTTSVFVSLLSPGMTVLDVGANIGYFAILAADAVGDAGRVVAFEPVEENWKLLVENVTMNGFQNVALEKAALADCDTAGRMFLYRKDVNSGMGSLMGNEANAGVEQRIVPMYTLDSFVRHTGLTHVDVVKMDIQGGEGRALDGMRETLAREPGPVLIWELNASVLAQHGDSACRLVGLLDEFGYANYLIGSKRFARIQPREADSLEDGVMIVSTRGAIAPPDGWLVDGD